jgi:hypothetical protein
MVLKKKQGLKRFCPEVGGNVQPLGKKEGRRCARSFSRFINNSIPLTLHSYISQQAILYGNLNGPHGLRNLTYTDGLLTANVGVKMGQVFGGSNEQACTRMGYCQCLARDFSPHF